MALEDVVLNGPVVLVDGQVIENKRFHVQEANFISTSVNAVIYGGNVENVVIRNVEIVGPDTWLHSWDADDDPAWPYAGIAPNVVGIRLQVAPNARIENVKISGIPAGGIRGHELSGLRLSDFETWNVLIGAKLGSNPNQPAGSDITIERFMVGNLWGPPNGSWEGVGNQPSVIDPTRAMGGDGLVLHSPIDALVTDALVLGEGFGAYKWVNPMNCRFHRLRGNFLMIQGWTDGVNSYGEEPSSGTAHYNCVIDKALGVGTKYDVPDYDDNNLTSGGNGIQLSYGMADVLFDSCHLNGYGYNGHGVELAAGTGGDPVERLVHATFRRCSVGDFNLKRGNVDAKAFHIRDVGCTLNDDCETANRFYRQLRTGFES